MSEKQIGVWVSVNGLNDYPDLLRVRWTKAECQEAIVALYGPYSHWKPRRAVITLSEAKP